MMLKPADSSNRSQLHGEREAIRLAKEFDADALLIDEPDGREAARAQGLRVIGTLRVLYDAAEAGLYDLEQVSTRSSKQECAQAPATQVQRVPLYTSDPGDLTHAHGVMLSLAPPVYSRRIIDSLDCCEAPMPREGKGILVYV